MHHGGAHLPYCRRVPGPEPLSLPPEELRRLGYGVIDRLVDHYATLDGKPPVPVPDPDWSAASVPPCPDGPTDPAAALDYLFDEVLARAQYTSHPRFFARIGAPSNPVSVLADLAGAGVNVFAGGWVGGAGPSAVELAVLGWLRDWMGMPDETEGVLVSGGSVGTLTALAAAALARVDARARAAGYVSEHTHSAVARAWRTLGFAADHLRVLEADERQRLPAGAVARAIEADRAAGLEPFVILATAGTTSTGAVDPLQELGRLAREQGLWFHVDGAYGAPARLTEGGRELLAGIEQADSLVLDPHKWLFQPYEVGCVLVREPGLLERAFALDGAYLRDTVTTEVQFRDRSPQLTRGSRALKLWLSLTVFGLDAFRAAIARGIALAELAEALLRERDGWEVVTPAQLAIVCFRRTAPGLSDAEVDALNDRMVAAAVADGFTAPSTTLLAGRPVARLCTINPRTTDEDVRATIERLERLAG
jgi:glutamate/tyrosine decarboxylase-like PLP-dependent enzyme